MEAYLAEYLGTLDGRSVEVDFLARLRDIKKFDSVDALLAQMAKDVARTVQEARQRHPRSKPPHDSLAAFC